MAKIDRLGWAAGTCFTSYGVRIGIRTNAPEVLRRLPAHLPPAWKPAASPLVDQLFSLWVGGDPRGRVRRFNLLYWGNTRRARSLDLDQVFETLESELRLRIAAGAKRKTFVHAGVVGWHGRAIVLPGRSCAGKTSLVAELPRAGATYYSDEFAVIDGRGRVCPFPKPLSIRESGNATGIPLPHPNEPTRPRSGPPALPRGTWTLTPSAVSHTQGSCPCGRVNVSSPSSWACSSCRPGSSTATRRAGPCPDCRRSDCTAAACGTSTTARAATSCTVSAASSAPT